MKNKSVPTYTATIYCGLKNRDTGFIHKASTLRLICQSYADSVGLCVSFTKTEFIYTNGNEPGVVIGLINYPRFPKSKSKIRLHAMRLAQRCLAAAQQFKVSVVFPEETVMLSKDKTL